MTDKEKQDELWGIRFADAVDKAGGVPEGTFEQFSSEPVQTMVRNGLSLHYEDREDGR